MPTTPPQVKVSGIGIWDTDENKRYIVISLLTHTSYCLHKQKSGPLSYRRKVLILRDGTEAPYQFWKVKPTENTVKPVKNNCNFTMIIRAVRVQRTATFTMAQAERTALFHYQEKKGKIWTRNHTNQHTLVALN